MSRDDVCLYALFWLAGRRWAGRGAVGYQQLAEDGFAVLGERLRSAEERAVVEQVLQKVLSVKVSQCRAGGEVGCKHCGSC